MVFEELFRRKGQLWDLIFLSLFMNVCLIVSVLQATAVGAVGASERRQLWPSTFKSKESGLPNTVGAVSTAAAITQI